MSKNRKLLLYLFLIIFFITMTILSFVFSNKTKVLETLLYVEKSNIDYQVCLKENVFYEENCQPKNMKYIASAINYIDVIFSYDFETNTDVNFDYEYYIDGIITVFDRNDSNNVLFTKTIELLEKKNLVKQDTNMFNISESLKIDYQEFNNLIRSFKSEYNISANSSLKLRLSISSTLSYEKFEDEITTDGELEMTIPLTENTINIGMNYKAINNSDKFVQSATKTIFNTIYLISSIVFAIFSILFSVSFSLEIYKNRRQKSKYDRFIINKIKNLDRMIVSAKHHIRINEKDYKEIIDVENFSELVDIAERLANVITWTEIINKKDKVSWFSVADGKRLYRIIYNSKDKEFK